MPHSAISSTYLPLSQGRRARNRALWDDCTPETWARVVGLYMLVGGIVGLANWIVAPLVEGTNPLGSLWPTRPDRAYSVLHAFGYVPLLASYVLRPFAAMLLWRDPRLLLVTLCIVCPLDWLANLLFVSATIALELGTSPTINGAASAAIAFLWDCMLFVYTLWVARRVRAGAPMRVMSFIACMLVTYGVCFSVSYSLRFLDPGPFGLSAAVARADWRHQIAYLTWPLVPLACLAIGLWLPLGPSKPLAPCASVLVLCSAATAVADLTSFGWHWHFEDDLVIALAFLIFVLAYRPRGDPANPTCATCGYSLRGLPTTGHRCPECGREFTLPAPPEPVGDHRAA